MIVVLDTSAAVELILDRDHSANIKKIISECNKVITSDLYKAEITNVFWKYLKAGFITKNDAVSYIGFSQEIIDEFYDISPFSVECLNEAMRLNHSTYDMLYLTLAKRTGGVLLTLDKRLSQVSKNEGIETPILEDCV